MSPPPDDSTPAIRPAAEVDVPALAALATHLGYPTDEATMRARMRRIGAHPDYATLVAESGGRVVGFAGMMWGWSYVGDGYARLLSLVVEPAQRGRGTGAALVAAVEEWGRARGAGSVRLTTALHRERTHRFYERLGYARTGLRYVKNLPGGDAETGASVR
jgi:GNAT superfamily N-acetyltransferase